MHINKIIFFLLSISLSPLFGMKEPRIEEIKINKKSIEPSKDLYTEEQINKIKPSFISSDRYGVYALSELNGLGLMSYISKSKEVPEDYKIVSEITGCTMCCLKSYEKTKFLNEFIAEIRKNIPSETSMVFTTFASGLLYYDLAILAELIQPKKVSDIGYKKIYINLIDPLYFNDSSDLAGDECFTKDKRYRSISTALKQFATFLASLAGADVTITTYHRIEDYTKDIKMETGKKSDVFLVFDFEDWESFLGEFGKAFQDLILNANAVYGFFNPDTPNHKAIKNIGIKKD